MSDFDPYKPPKTPTAEFLEFHSQGIKRYGKNGLFVPIGMDLPARCIYCNQPITDKPIKRTYYHDRIYPFFIIVIGVVLSILLDAIEFLGLGIIISVIVLAITQRKVVIHIGLCRKHWQKYISFRFCCFIIFMISFFAIFLIAKSTIENIWILFSIFIMLISLLIMNFAYSLPTSTKIDETGCYLKGFGKEFLQSFE